MLVRWGTAAVVIALERVTGALGVVMRRGLARSLQRERKRFGFLAAQTVVHRLSNSAPGGAVWSVPPISDRAILCCSSGLLMGALCTENQATSEM
jgi:hypothetical protein